MHPTISQRSVKQGGMNKAGEGDVSDIADEGRRLLKTRSR